MGTVIEQQPSDAPARTVHVERAMGTVVSFDLRGSGDHAAGIRDAVAVLHDIDRRFSPYLPDSEVSRYGRGALGPDEQSSDLREVIEACDAVAAISGGAFDAHRGGRFDPSAYVKGWAVERAGDALALHGCGNRSINAGGDVRVTSADRTRGPWRIGVQHPFDPSALGMVLHAEEVAVATSGLYERGEHIDDPRSGGRATAVASTTVCGPHLGLADAFATAAFVLGEDGCAWVAALPGYECWTVLLDGRVVATNGFPRIDHGVPLRTSPAREPVAVLA